MFLWYNGYRREKEGQITYQCYEMNKGDKRVDNTMDFENLEVGKKYKSYRELCEALGVNPRAGNSKKAQMKQINANIDYTKEGNGFIIREVYIIPEEIEDGRAGRQVVDYEEFSSSQGALGESWGL